MALCRLPTLTRSTKVIVQSATETTPSHGRKSCGLTLKRRKPQRDNFTIYICLTNTSSARFQTPETVPVPGVLVIDSWFPGWRNNQTNQSIVQIKHGKLNLPLSKWVSLANHSYISVTVKRILIHLSNQQGKSMLHYGGEGGLWVMKCIETTSVSLLFLLTVTIPQY